ncbi:ABC transporter ATP-binding protein [Pseudonocardia acaciae]|uniref:ABC transporter ATP-binding protein n=1 Tax=Pseudonocardia acaciae TaxID=551276 RepID=UPI000ABD6449|nr:ABC transporter ATP-binding protein [Pseudonocardia acaciae]
MTPEIEVDNVSVRFSSKHATTSALRDVTFEVAPKGFVSIVGPSGCGKSTLLKLIAGLLRPSAGELRLRGTPVTSTHREIGFVFQKAALLEWRTVRRNITIQGEMRDLPKREVATAADELMELTGLTDFADAMPHELSGGMQQRVAVCRALLHKPSVLLMDEPFGALDALTREAMNVELRHVWRQTGTTIVLVTHSVAEAVYLSDRVVVLTARPGRVAEVLDIDLPVHRDYSDTMRSDEFGKKTTTLRALLGSSHAGNHD